MKLEGIIMCSEHTWLIKNSEDKLISLYVAQRLTYGIAADLT